MGAFAAHQGVDQALLAGHERMFLGCVVAEDRALGNSYACGDVADRCGVKALLLHQVQRGALDLTQHPGAAFFTDTHGSSLSLNAAAAPAGAGARKSISHVTL